MTREEAFNVLRCYPGVPITHIYFGENYYLVTTKRYGPVFDSTGVMVEDWDFESSNSFLRDMHFEAKYDNGWMLYVNDECKLYSMLVLYDDLPPIETLTGTKKFSIEVLAYSGSKYFSAFYDFTDNYWVNTLDGSIVKDKVQWSCLPKNIMFEHK